MLADDPSARYATTGEVLNAISALPTEPSWETTVAPDLVRWELPAPKRMKVVEWKLHSERRHEWKAWSQPLGAGRVMTLKQSPGVIGRRQVDRELENYFSE
ncbi:hypothetical protein D3C79_998290 [compost metagenome]